MIFLLKSLHFPAKIVKFSHKLRTIPKSKTTIFFGAPSEVVTKNIRRVFPPEEKTSAPLTLQMNAENFWNE